MHYYQFNIGDYASHTRGLSLLEDLAYRRLIDEYYLAERALNGCSTDVARLIGFVQHAAEVEYILTRFFVATKSGWVHERIETEIAEFKDKQKKNAKAGKASAAARKNKGVRTDVQQTFNERSTTVQPTINQEPLTNNQSSSLRSEEQPAPKRQPVSKVSKPVDVTEEVWQSFQTIRKTKKAAITDLAVLGIRREAVKAGLTLEQAMTTCCERGWAGFKAEWVERDTPAAKGASESFYERDLRAKQERWAEMTGKPFPTDDAIVIDITPTTLEISHEPANQSR